MPKSYYFQIREKQVLWGDVIVKVKAENLIDAQRKLYINEYEFQDYADETDPNNLPVRIVSRTMDTTTREKILKIGE